MSDEPLLPVSPGPDYPHEEPKPQFLRCVDPSGYPLSLRKGGEYRWIRDRGAEMTGMVRVVDESGDDFLFALHRFIPVGGVWDIQVLQISPSVPIGKT